jgi:hypothetical protein
MTGHRRFFEMDERLKWLSAAGNPLVWLSAVEHFYQFPLIRTHEPSRGGRWR